MSTTQIKDSASDSQLKVNPDGSINVIAAGSEGSVDMTMQGLGAFQTSQYNVGTSPVQLAPTPLANRPSISISAEAAPNVPVYIGNSSSVTVNNGYPLYDGSSLQLDLTTTGQVWAVSNTTGSIACVLEMA